jgi:hypothetical protein
MNSSANQISPVSQRREISSRLAHFSNQQVLAGRLPITLPRTAASGPEYAVNGGGYARRKAWACSDGRLTVGRTIQANQTGGRDRPPNPTESIR